MKTKIRIHEACIPSTLLYGTEIWTLYSGQEKRLNVFYLRCLRKIMGISWQDKVTNAEVLARVNLPNMTAILCKRKLRWLGHVRRMDDSRIPKQLLFGELAHGKQIQRKTEAEIQRHMQEQFDQMWHRFQDLGGRSK